MANIFANQKEYVEKHKRNTFDLSFTNNLTFDFGDLVPVFCKEVIPGDSFSILPSFGLRLMPLVFPIQTRMNANLHFFYVRNRNLWKDWPDFIGRTKPNLVPPYLSASSARLIATGSLADYLGCPTTLIGDYGNRKRSYSGEKLIDDVVLDNDIMCLLPYYVGHTFAASGFLRHVDGHLESLSSVITHSVSSSASVSDDMVAPTVGSSRMFITPPFSFSQIADDIRDLTFVQSLDTSISFDNIIIALWVFRDGDWYPDLVLHNKRGGATYAFDENDLDFDDISTAEHSAGKYYFDLDHASDLRFQLQDPIRFPNVVYSFSEVLDYLRSLGSDQVRLSIASQYYSAIEGEYNSGNLTGIDGSAFSMLADYNPFIESVTVSFKSSDGILDITDAGVLNAYTYGASSFKISSLPFRAYDSIYNCFYRNQFNDPFILDGVKEYNKFIRSNEGGEDSLQYRLYKRNYELDFLTSARQSPVDGDITPLVGVNASGQFTFKNADDTTYTVTPIIGDDGHTLTGIESMEGTPENNSGLRRLVDMISLGISINDFRNVNALQRWLETNLRRGYRYKD